MGRLLWNVLLWTVLMFLVPPGIGLMGGVGVDELLLVAVVYVAGLVVILVRFSQQRSGSRQTGS
jgi:putative effector of murein hydrolase LrgA (UPF0299 family)